MLRLGECDYHFLIVMDINARIQKIQRLRNQQKRARRVYKTVCLYNICNSFRYSISLVIENLNAILLPTLILHEEKSLKPFSLDVYKDMTFLEILQIGSVLVYMLLM